MTEATVVQTRPNPGEPRPYDFPAVERTRLQNGLWIVIADLPGRPLVSAQLVVEESAGKFRFRHGFLF